MHAQGQTEEKKVKVEKYYRPKFEVFVRMPTFIFDTAQVNNNNINLNLSYLIITTLQVIKAEVSSAYLFEKEAKGTIHLRWFAKKVKTEKYLQCGCVSPEQTKF